MQRLEPGIQYISCYSFNRNSGRELAQKESEESNRFCKFVDDDRL